MLSDGKIELIGTVKKVAEAYSRSNAEPVGSEPVVDEAKSSPEDIKLTGCDATYKPGDVMQLRIEWPEIKEVGKVGVAILGSKDELVFASNTGDAVITRQQIDYSMNLDLGPGSYYLTVALYDKKGKNVGFYEKKWRFRIYDDYRNDLGGQVRLKHNYSPIEQKS